MTTTATVVTIPARVFVRDALAAMETATTAHAEAIGLLALARARAARAPRDFHTPGGASADDMLAVMAEDRQQIHAATVAAGEHLEAARAATDVPTAAEHAHMAQVYGRAARFDTDTMARYLAYLPA